MATESSAPTARTASDADRAASIADILLGNESNEDVREEETPAQASTTEVEESPETETEEVLAASEDEDDGEEEELPVAASADDDDEDLTWEKILGVSEGQLNFDEEGNLVGFNTKVNGESTTVKAADLIAGFQNNKAFTQKSQALAEQQKAFEDEVSNVRTEYAKKLHTVDSLNKYFENQLLQSYNGIDWETLRANNPAEYAATRQDFQTRALEFQQINQAILTDMDKARQEYQGAMQKQMEEFKTQQRALMVETNPAWADDKAYDSAMSGFKDFVNDAYGFSAEEFDSVMDARLIQLVQDAQKFREGKKLVESKQVQKLPKFQKSSGRRPSKKTTKLEKLTAASKKATGANKRQLQRDAVAELLLGNG